MNENLISELTDWVKPFFPEKYSIDSASADASFRSYFRVTSTEKTNIIMVAPPEHEPISPFLDITQRLFKAKINIPKIYKICLLYTSPSPRDRTRSRMPSSA